VNHFELKDLEGRGIGRFAVIGQVVGVYIDDRFLVDGRVESSAMRTLARCGYLDYTVIDKLFPLRDRSLRRPAPRNPQSSE
jgi:hypothetical protein